MKFIKYFTWITTGISILGFLFLLNEGTLDIYGIWNVTTLGLASYYMAKK